MVIWSRFVEVVNFLTHRYQKLGAVCINGSVPEQDRAKIIEDFQTDAKTMVFVGQIQSCGVGMTLHRASIEVFYDKCFLSAAMITQAEDRLHRIGMGDRCTVISLIAQGTIDEHWEALLLTKLRSADDVLGESTSDRGGIDALNKEDVLRLLLVDKKD